MTVGAGRAATRRARQRKTRGRAILRSTALGLALLMAAAGATTYVVYRKLNGNITEDDIAGKLDGTRPAVLPADADGRPLNILLIGSDSRTGGNRKLGGGKDTGQRSDTTILLHITGDRKRATALSFPRDTMVEVPSCVLPGGERSRPKLDMFNKAFQEGGTACTVKTVEKLTDIRVDHHLVIDFKGFAKMVDAVDGVPICLPKAVNDKTGKIRLDGGRRPVFGQEALDYVRLRYDGSIGGQGNDLDRIKRQQAFLSALATKIKSTGVLLNPVRLLGLLDAATKSVTTDPELGSVRKLAELAESLRGLETQDITFVTAPVHPYQPDPNRLEITRPAADEVFHAIKFGKPLTEPAAPKPAGAGSAGAGSTARKPPATALTVPPSRVPVQVLNGSGTPGTAKRAAAELRRHGFQVVGFAGSDRVVRRTTVRYPAGRASAARTLQAAVPGSIRTADESRGSVLSLVVGTDFDASKVRPVTIPGTAGTTPALAAPTAPPEVETRTADKDICA